ncbi:hypothetical protein QJQ45_030032 [Haematococcus lacustris]|nr:hypothetical protein QJQ45_030032 [Haematococcus lacustris]
MTLHAAALAEAEAKAEATAQAAAAAAAEAQAALQAKTAALAEAEAKAEATTQAAAAAAAEAQAALQAKTAALAEAEAKAEVTAQVAAAAAAVTLHVHMSMHAAALAEAEAKAEATARAAVAAAAEANAALQAKRRVEAVCLGLHDQLSVQSVALDHLQRSQALWDDATKKLHMALSAYNSAQVHADVVTRESLTAAEAGVSDAAIHSQSAMACIANLQSSTQALHYQVMEVEQLHRLNQIARSEAAAAKADLELAQLQIRQLSVSHAVDVAITKAVMQQQIDELKADLQCKADTLMELTCGFGRDLEISPVSSRDMASPLASGQGWQELTFSHNVVELEDSDGRATTQATHAGPFEPASLTRGQSFVAMRGQLEAMQAEMQQIQLDLMAHHEGLTVAEQIPAALNITDIQARDPSGWYQRASPIRPPQGWKFSSSLAPLPETHTAPDSPSASAQTPASSQVDASSGSSSLSSPPSPSALGAHSGGVMSTPGLITPEASYPMHGHSRPGSARLSVSSPQSMLERLGQVLQQLEGLKDFCGDGDQPAPAGAAQAEGAQPNCAAGQAAGASCTAGAGSGPAAGSRRTASSQGAGGKGGGAIGNTEGGQQLEGLLFLRSTEEGEQGLSNMVGAPGIEHNTPLPTADTSSHPSRPHVPPLDLGAILAPSLLPRHPAMQSFSSAPVRPMSPLSRTSLGPSLSPRASAAGAPDQAHHSLDRSRNHSFHCLPQQQQTLSHQQPTQGHTMPQQQLGCHVEQRPIHRRGGSMGHAQLAALSGAQPQVDQAAQPPYSTWNKVDQAERGRSRMGLANSSEQQGAVPTTGRARGSLDLPRQHQRQQMLPHHQHHPSGRAGTVQRAESLATSSHASAHQAHGGQLPAASHSASHSVREFSKAAKSSHVGQAKSGSNHMATQPKSLSLTSRTRAASFTGRSPWGAAQGTAPSLPPARLKTSASHAPTGAASGHYAHMYQALHPSKPTKPAAPGYHSANLWPATTLYHNPIALTGRFSGGGVLARTPQGNWVPAPSEAPPLGQASWDVLKGRCSAPGTPGTYGSPEQSNSSAVTFELPSPGKPQPQLGRLSPLSGLAKTLQADLQAQQQQQQQQRRSLDDRTPPQVAQAEPERSDSVSCPLLQLPDLPSQCRMSAFASVSKCLCLSAILHSNRSRCLDLPVTCLQREISNPRSAGGGSAGSGRAAANTVLQFPPPFYYTQESGVEMASPRLPGPPWSPTDPPAPAATLLPAPRTLEAQGPAQCTALQSQPVMHGAHAAGADPVHGGAGGVVALVTSAGGAQKVEADSGGSPTDLDQLYAAPGSTPAQQQPSDASSATVSCPTLPPSTTGPTAPAASPFASEMEQQACLPRLQLIPDPSFQPVPCDSPSQLQASSSSITKPLASTTAVSAPTITLTATTVTRRSTTGATPPQIEPMGSSHSLRSATALGGRIHVPAQPLLTGTWGRATPDGPEVWLTALHPADRSRQASLPNSAAASPAPPRQGSLARTSRPPAVASAATAALEARAIARQVSGGTMSAASSASGYAARDESMQPNAAKMGCGGALSGLLRSSSQRGRSHSGQASRAASFADSDVRSSHGMPTRPVHRGGSVDQQYSTYMLGSPGAQPRLMTHMPYDYASTSGIGLDGNASVASLDSTTMSTVTEKTKRSLGQRIQHKLTKLFSTTKEAPPKHGHGHA